MDIEFHYYIIYILVRKAGFDENESSVIAYASQYTDDNTLHYCINCEMDNPYLSSVSQTMDITKPNEKRKSIYPVFHFFPGDPDSPTAKRKDGKANKFNTTPDSKNARDAFENAFKSKNLYRIGIASHVYADTWAHQNFCGSKDKFNNMSGLIAGIMPNIGHADAGHNPDIVCHKWEDDRLIDENRKIDNNTRFIDAAEKIFYAFKRYKDPQIDDQNLNTSWSDVKELLLNAMNKRSIFGSFFDLSQKARIKAYRGICKDIPNYDEDAWRHNAVKKDEWEVDYFDKYWTKDDSKFKESHWYKFQEAIKEHHDVSMGILKSLYS